MMKTRFAIAMLAAVMFAGSASAGWSRPHMSGWMNNGGHQAPKSQDNDMVKVCMPKIVKHNRHWSMNWVCKTIDRDNRPDRPQQDTGGQDKPKNWFGKRDNKRGGKKMKMIIKMMKHKMHRHGGKHCQPKKQPKPPTGVPTPGAAGAGMAMLGLIAARRRRKG